MAVVGFQEEGVGEVAISLAEEMIDLEGEEVVVAKANGERSLKLSQLTADGREDVLV